MMKFVLEKELLKLFNHKNIVQLYKAFQTKDKFYYELEYLEYGNLG